VQRAFIKATEAVLVILCYAALAVWIFHPLFADPAHTILDPDHRWLDKRWLVPRSMLDWNQILLRDIRVIIWVLAWDWHALKESTWNLFDANIFHPAPASLAYWEHLIGHLPVTVPVFALSDNPVLAHQINLLMSFALSGAAIYALLRHWGTERAAALLAGFAYAFCPIRLNTIFHSNLLAMQYLPLSLLFLDRTLSGRRVRDASAYSFFLFMQVLCSFYLGYMALTALMGYAAGVAVASRGRLPLRGVLLVFGGSLVAVASVVLLSLPYLRTQAGGGLPDYSTWHPLVTAWSNGLWRNYFYPPVALREWGYQLGKGRCVYLGIVPLALAVLTLTRAGGRRVRGRQVVMGAIGIILVAYVMALGPEFMVGGLRLPLPYTLAMEVIPGFSAMRVPARFGLVLMFGFAILVGLGFDRLCSLLRSRRSPRGAVIASLLLVSFLTAYEYDLGRQRYGVLRVDLGPRLPHVYRALTGQPRAPVVEIPIGSRYGFEASEYMLYGTAHWYPLLNGTSAYDPPSYAEVKRLAKALPNPVALQVLAQATGVRDVIVHQQRLTREQRELWRSPEGLRLVTSSGDDVLYEVEDPPEPHLLPELVSCARDRRSCPRFSQRALDAAVEFVQTKQ
jgi:hypothetical protein